MVVAVIGPVLAARVAAVVHSRGSCLALLLLLLLLLLFASANC